MYSQFTGLPYTHGGEGDYDATDPERGEPFLFFSREGNEGKVCIHRFVRRRPVPLLQQVRPRGDGRATGPVPRAAAAVQDAPDQDGGVPLAVSLSLR